MLAICLKAVAEVLRRLSKHHRAFGAFDLDLVINHGQSLKVDTLPSIIPPFANQPRFTAECASSATEGFRQESAGQKRFATDVVAAMSNPALKPNEEVAELPERQFTTGKSEGS